MDNWYKEDDSGAIKGPSQWEFVNHPAE